MSLKRIGITMRQEAALHTGETRDQLAADWARYFAEALPSAVPVPLFNHPEKVSAWADRLALDGIILSGGGSPADGSRRDQTERALLRWSLDRQRPVLGICRGFQAIQTALGGTLHKVENHVQQMHSIRFSNPALRPRKVNSFHDDGILTLADGLTATAWAEDGSIEAAVGQKGLWLGLMWHPEREVTSDPQDKQTIQALFNLTSQARDLE